MKQIKTIFRICRLRLKALSLFVYDYRDHIKYCAYYHLPSHYTRDMMKCAIMLLNHQLEKAQTYKEQKEGYGKDKIKSLLRYIELYITKYGYDSIVYTAIGVMQSHFDNSYSYKNAELVERYKSIEEHAPYKNQIFKKGGGRIVCNLSSIKHIDGLYEFLNSRRSCRQYSDQLIDLNEIILAVKYAMTAPSACNRQCVRVHYFDNAELIKEIIYAQKSDVNWCLNAKGLFIITANKSSFRDYFERNQRLFDAGLFSMNLVLGLHNQGIGSCFKMAQKETSIERQAKKISDIPECEGICVLLLIGKYPNNEIVLAKSARIDINDVLTKH